MKSEWLREPQAGGSNVIYISLGKTEKLNPEVSAALEKLSKAIADHKGAASPHMACDARVNCDPYGDCRPQIAQPCAWFTSCRIAD